VLHFNIELEEVCWRGSQAERKITGKMGGLFFPRPEKRTLGSMFYAIIRGL
jgi:hypothetical protein